jgi:cytochrome c5
MMIHQSRMKREHTRGVGMPGWIALAAAALMPASVMAAQVRPAERSAKEMFETHCAKCHATGQFGAPRIGDDKAWHDRAQRGLSGLTQTALAGVRNMPPHGGAMQLTDLELKRVITYMVNQSGGKWIEPIGVRPAEPRSGREIVEARCSQCHEAGKGGAPRIGDRAAWIPRLSLGFEHTVRSAIHGHGGMPARGGLPDLTDHEIRGAIVYMFSATPAATASK